MNFAGLLAWCELKGVVTHHYSFMDNFQRKSMLYYFHAKLDLTEISINYRKYKNRFVIVSAAVKVKSKLSNYYTVKELNAALTDNI